jgi:hypothetical protein
MINTELCTPEFQNPENKSIIQPKFLAYLLEMLSILIFAPKRRYSAFMKVLGVNAYIKK